MIDQEDTAMALFCQAGDEWGRCDRPASSVMTVHDGEDASSITIPVCEHHVERMRAELAELPDEQPEESETEEAQH